MKRYKIGIIGCGHIAEKMATTLNSMPDVECYAVASRSRQKADEFASKWHFSKAYGSYEALADDPEVDLIYIATPHAFHFEQAMMCISKGKPVLCEKSFTANASQAEKLIEYAHKMIRLVKAAGIENIDFDGKFTAIKIHFGEPGNLAYLRPNYAARLIDFVRAKVAKVFLTDSNTLYSGGRSNAVDHLDAAMNNGYNPIGAHANVIIADGLKGTEYKEIPLEGEYCKAPKIGSAIADADIIISMNHFKGHEQAGFGGALKNLGMGSASVGGKMELHCSSQPRIDAQACTGCGMCEKYCKHHAISMISEADSRRRKASIDYTKCVGCGQCVAVCQHNGAVIGNSSSAEELNYKIA